MGANTEAIEQLNRALEGLGRDLEAVELHGVLAGMLSANPALKEGEWLDFVAGGREEGEGEAVLAALYTETVRQLGSAVLDFHPLLPDEDAALEERVESLGEWVQGYLLGLAEGGAKDLDKMPADSAEIVRDFVEIAGAGGYELGEEEEDEQAFSELLEFVRTGVLLVNEELNPTKAPPRGDTTLH